MHRQKRWGYFFGYTNTHNSLVIYKLWYSTLVTTYYLGVHVRTLGYVTTRLSSHKVGSCSLRVDFGPWEEIGLRSHFPLKEIFQNAQLNSCTRYLIGKLSRPHSIFAVVKLKIFTSVLYTVYLFVISLGVKLTWGWHVILTYTQWFCCFGLISGESIITNLTLESARLLKNHSAYIW